MYRKSQVVASIEQKLKQAVVAQGQGLGFQVLELWGLGFRIWGSGLIGFRVQDFGIVVEGYRKQP